MFAHRRRCPSCNAAVPQGAVICARCGHRLDDPALPQLCPSCGARTDSHAAACLICGARWEAVRAPRVWRRIAVAGVILATTVTVGAAWRLAPALRSFVRERVAGRVGLFVEGARALLTTPAGEATPAPLADLTRAVVARSPLSLPSATPRTNTSTPLAAATPSRLLPTATIEEARAPVVPTSLAPSETATDKVEPVTPSTVVHVVQKGDNLGALAVRYGVAADEIARANGIALDGVLSLGQRLVIAGARPATPTPTVLPPTNTPTQAPTSSPAPGATPTPTASRSASPALSGVAAVIAAERQARATVTPTAAPPPTATLRVHVMVQGEHIGILAQKYAVGSAEIAKANGISEEAILSVGQRLIIPERGSGARASAGASATATASNRTPLPRATATTTPGVITHVVGKGDTLGAIAVRYGVASERIAEVNGIALRAVLQPGQSLRIPGVVEMRALPTGVPASAATSPSAMLPRLPTPSLTPLPTSAYRYRTPTLLWPTNGSAIEDLAAPLLSWASVGILADAEWYELRLWMPGEPDEPTTVHTKGTSYRMEEKDSLEARRTSRFAWQVMVVSRNALAGAQSPVSASSEVYAFVLE